MSLVRNDNLKIMLVKVGDEDLREQIADTLMNGTTVIVNYEEVSGAARKQIEDFVSGVVYASDLSETQISDDIIIYGVDVNGYEYPEEISE